MPKKSPPRSPVGSPPSISPEEGITLLQELITRGELLSHRSVTDAEMAAYRAALSTALSESLGSDADLTMRTMDARGNINLNPYDATPHSQMFHSEVIAKLLMLRECVRHLTRVAARKPTAPTPSEPAALDVLIKILSGFHRSAKTMRDRYGDRQPLLMNDEHDVQYLLHALLVAFFRDVRPEDTGPSRGGARPRIDFILKNEQIAIEAKRTRPTLKDKEIGEELYTDIGRYKDHSDCKTLVCFVYDPEEHIANAEELIRDLEDESSDRLRIRVLVVPQH